MWSIIALGAAERFMNQIIDLDAISRIQFNALAPQMLRVVIDSPQLSLDVFFDDNKVRLQATATGQATRPSVFEQRPFDPQHNIIEATATLHVSTVIELLKLLLAAPNTIGNIPLQGDYRLLQNIQKIMQQMQPDLAAQLSRWIGPVAAHELGKIQLAAKQLGRSAQSQLFFAQDTLKEDCALFAPQWQMDDLQQDTRQLNQDIDRLEAKIQQLRNQLDSTKQDA